MSTEKVNRIFNSDWIHKLESKKQWELYWMQQKLIEEFVDKKDIIAELGVGSGFTSNYLKIKALILKTIDIDKTKNPDICCNMLDWQPKQNYTTFLSFEVLEHVPFNEVELFIAKLKELNIKKLIISVPYNGRHLFSMRIKLPFIKEKNFYQKWPLIGHTKIRIKSHFWELNDGKISEKIFLNVFSKNNYKLVSKNPIINKLFMTFHLN